MELINYAKAFGGLKEAATDTLQCRNCYTIKIHVAFIIFLHIIQKHAYI